MFQLLSVLFAVLFVSFSSRGVEGFLQQQHRTTSSTNSPTSLNIIWDPKSNVDQMNSELVEFPTPSQKSVLRKEASKRQARKKLPIFSLPSDETLGNFSDESLDNIWELLQEHELVQVRGISRDERKMAFTLATRLCLDLEWQQEKFADLDDTVVLPVALLSTKGHSAIIYSPTLDPDDAKKFPLRTSVGQKNTWTERIKAPRDNRGQIIHEKKE